MHGSGQGPPPTAEGSGHLLHRELCYSIRGAVYDVFRTLGTGFAGKVYERALQYELAARGIAVTAQAPLVVRYKDAVVGEYFVDLLVEDA